MAHVLVNLASADPRPKRQHMASPAAHSTSSWRLWSARPACPARCRPAHPTWGTTPRAAAAPPSPASLVGGVGAGVRQPGRRGAPCMHFVNIHGSRGTGTRQCCARRTGTSLSGSVAGAGAGAAAMGSASTMGPAAGRSSCVQKSPCCRAAPAGLGAGAGAAPPLPWTVHLQQSLLEPAAGCWGWLRSRALWMQGARGERRSRGVASEATAHWQGPCSDTRLCRQVAVCTCQHPPG